MFKLLPENNSGFGKTKANFGDARTPDAGWSFELMINWIWSWQRIRKISPTQISLAQPYYSGLKWHYYRTHSPWMKELSSIKMQMPRKRQHKNRSIIYTLMRNCHSNPFQHYNYLRLSTGRILDETESCWEPRVRREKKKGNETMLRLNDTIYNVTKTLTHRWQTGIGGSMLSSRKTAIVKPLSGILTFEENHIILCSLPYLEDHHSCWRVLRYHPPNGHGSVFRKSV